jgi:methylated-DNA-[protein]-cysteine S-methyltransferase
MMITETTSPIGPIRFMLHEGRLCSLEFADRWKRGASAEQRRREATREDPSDVLERLRAYFGGALDAFAGLPVEPAGTSFQRRVWTAMRRIPPGRTASYGDLARAIGTPSAARAVGAASGSNPVGIVIPCHRVIGSDGTLTGYGGGLDRKQWLLRHEGVML